MKKGARTDLIPNLLIESLLPDLTINRHFDDFGFDLI